MLHVTRRSFFSPDFSTIYTFQMTGQHKSQQQNTEPVFVDLLRRPGIDSQPGGPVRNSTVFVVLARQAT
jgi:hypothetical protein